MYFELIIFEGQGPDSRSLVLAGKAPAPRAQDGSPNRPTTPSMRRVWGPACHHSTGVLSRIRRRGNRRVAGTIRGSEETVALQGIREPSVHFGRFGGAAERGEGRTSPRTRERRLGARREDLRGGVPEQRHVRVGQERVEVGTARKRCGAREPGPYPRLHLVRGPCPEPRAASDCVGQRRKPPSSAGFCPSSTSSVARSLLVRLASSVPHTASMPCGSGRLARMYGLSSGISRPLGARCIHCIPSPATSPCQCFSSTT